MRPRRGRKFEITELILELRFIYETAPDGFSYLSPPCTTPTAALYAAGATWLATWPLPGRNHLVRPWFSQTRYLLALPELDTRPAASSARHADALAGHCAPLPELHQAALPQLACAQLLPPSLQL